MSRRRKTPIMEDFDRLIAGIGQLDERDLVESLTRLRRRVQRIERLYAEALRNEDPNWLAMP